MGQVIQFPHKVSIDLHFGGCPECGQTDGYINIQSNHFFVCDAHNVAWSIGSNLFSEWRDEPQAVWEANEAKLRTMEIVKPVYPDDPEVA